MKTRWEQEKNQIDCTIASLLPFGGRRFSLETERSDCSCEMSKGQRTRSEEEAETAEWSRKAVSGGGGGGTGQVGRNVDAIIKNTILRTKIF